MIWKENENPLFIEITNRCNFHCSFCPHDQLKRARGEIHFQLAKKFLEEAKEYYAKIPYVDLAVLGEPFANKKVFDYIKLCRQKQCPIYLITNGSLLSEKGIKTLMKRHGKAGVIEISYQTPTERTYTRRGNSKLTLDEYFAQIQRIIEAKFRYGAENGILIPICSYEFTLRNDSTVYFEKEMKSLSMFDSRDEAQEWYRIWREKINALAENIAKKYKRNLRRMPRSTWENVYQEKDLKLENLLDMNDGKLRYYEILPGVLIYVKQFGFWTRKKELLQQMLQEDKDIFIYIEEQTEDFQCEMAGKIGILENGEIVPCCLDYEGEASLGNGNDIDVSSALFAEKLDAFRNNLKDYSVCRTCHGRVFVLDTSPTEEDQVVGAYGGDWNPKEKDTTGQEFRWSTGTSTFYAYSRKTIREVAICGGPYSELKKMGGDLLVETYDEANDTFQEFSVIPFEISEKWRDYSIPCALPCGKFFRMTLKTEHAPEKHEDGSVRNLGIMVEKILLR